MCIFKNVVLNTAVETIQIFFDILLINCVRFMLKILKNHLSLTIKKFMS